VSLVSLAEVKTALGIINASGEQDVFLNRMIALADDTARGYTGRYLSSAQFTETFYAPQKVTLREWPLVSLDTVTQDGTSLTTGNLRADFERGRIWRPDGQSMDWTGTNKLEVVYTAGYAAIPADLKEWAYLLIKAKWDAWGENRGVEPGGASVSRVQNPDGGAVSYLTAGAVGGTVSDVPDFQAGVPLSALDRYRDPTPDASDEYSVWVKP